MFAKIDVRDVVWPEELNSASISCSYAALREFLPSAKDTSAMKTSETVNTPPADPTAAGATEHPITPSPSAVPSAQTFSTEVLITEQEVMFSTAAAAASRPQNRIAAMLGRVFATETAESRERRLQNLQRRTYYTECARMGREMDRL